MRSAAAGRSVSFECAAGDWAAGVCARGLSSRFWETSGDWAIVLDAFCSACKNETREASVSLPGVKRRQRVAADRDRIRRSLLAGASQADQQATAVLRPARGALS